CLSAFEAELSVVFTSDRLHFSIFGEAAHVEAPDTAVTRGPDDPAHEQSAEPVILPVPLDRKGCFRVIGPSVTELPQLGGRAQFAALEKAINDAAHFVHTIGVIGNKGIGHTVREAHAAAFLIEP